MYRQQPESMDSNSTKVSEYPSSLLTSRVQWSLRDYGPARKKTRIPFKRSSLSFSLSLSPGQLTISWNIFLPETRRYPFSARSRDFSRSIPSRLGVSIAFRVLSVTERERGYHDDIVIVNEWERRRFDRETRTNERGRVSLLAHVWSRHPVRWIYKDTYG